MPSATENTSTHPTEGFLVCAYPPPPPHPYGNSSFASNVSLELLAFDTPRNFQQPSLGQVDIAAYLSSRG